VTTAVTVIVNPTAGTGAAAGCLADVRQELARCGIEADIVSSDNCEHATELAREAATRTPLVAALGGDGMARAVAEGVCGSQAALAVLPSGRGNDFAATLGIPRDPAGAVAVLAAGVTRKVDVIEAGERICLGIASMGMDTDVHRHAEATRLARGRAVYAYGLLRTLGGWKPVPMRVCVDGVEHVFTGHSVAVANTPRYGGGMYIAPTARIDDGLLEVVMIGHVPGRPLWLQLATQVPALAQRKPLTHAGVRTARGREVVLDAGQRLEVFADGDHIGHTPLTVRVVPEALTVLAPPPGPSTQS